MNSSENLHNLINEWKQKAEVAHKGHYDAGIFYERFFLFLGIPVIVLSALTGGSEILGVIEKQVGGVISLCIAVLAGLQTFLKFSQRSERHRIAGAHYGAIKRSLEETLITLVDSNDEAKAEVHEIKNKLDSLACESPEIPKKILKKYAIK
jgi:hypothetical protein